MAPITYSAVIDWQNYLRLFNKSGEKLMLNVCQNDELGEVRL